MIHKPLAEIGFDDLQQLVSQGVAESRSLEYKQALPGANADDKKEFLADVSSVCERCRRRPSLRHHGSTRGREVDWDPSVAGGSRGRER